MKRLKGFLGVFLIFLFGVIVGIAISAGAVNRKIREIVEGGPEKVVALVVKRLNAELKLDASQQARLQQIATETQSELTTVRQQSKPRVDEILGNAAREVRAILKPEQVPKFEEIIRRGRNNPPAKPPTA